MAAAVIAAGLAAGALVVFGGAEELDGAAVYTRRCAFCHDVEGSIGAEITAETIEWYGSEEILIRYLRMAMPYEAPGSLTDAEYRASARYLMESRGLDEEP